jgi:hypothetical protein
LPFPAISGKEKNFKCHNKEKGREKKSTVKFIDVVVAGIGYG